jgi:hypothetical protein
MSFLVLYGFSPLHLQSALVGQPGCQEVPAQRRQRSNERVVGDSSPTVIWITVGSESAVILPECWRTPKEGGDEIVSPIVQNHERLTVAIELHLFVGDVIVASQNDKLMPVRSACEFL